MALQIGALAIPIWVGRRDQSPLLFRIGNVPIQKLNDIQFDVKCLISG